MLNSNKEVEKNPGLTLTCFY